MDGAELKICNAGVFDVTKLNIKGKITEFDFSFDEFLEKTPQWDPPDARQEYEYPVSYVIKQDDISGNLAGFSVNKLMADGNKRTLQSVVKEYMLSVGSANHMFCIYSHPEPHIFYSRTTLETIIKAPKPRRYFPAVLILTHNERMARNARRNLDTKKSGNYRLQYIKVRDLAGGLPQGPSLFETTERRPIIDIAIGSTPHVTMYLSQLKADREIDMLKMNVKHVIILGAERLTRDKRFREACQKISAEFKFSPARFIFFYSHSASKCSPARAQKECASLVRGPMYIEVEKHGVHDIFDRIEIMPVVPVDEFVDGLVALHIESGAKLEDNPFQNARKCQTQPMQKIDMCISLIEKLRLERNTYNREHQKARKERILIVTRNAFTTFFVCNFLKMHPQKTPPQPFTVDFLAYSSTIEAVENRNLDFRWRDLDVLVIDWKSIHDVNRGTVDAVIFHDAPPKKYFQTILEAELKSLVSRNCVKIKLYILFDVDKDIMLMAKYCNFLYKYNKPAPQWLKALEDKYRRIWEEKGREREYDPENSSDEEDFMINFLQPLT